jgi:tRNA pseudouridine38-40 synthase
MRAARTDKGVSAVGNVCSLKMMLPEPDLLQKINAALPPQVGKRGRPPLPFSSTAR